jgi:hypothetical protein
MCRLSLETLLAQKLMKRWYYVEQRLYMTVVDKRAGARFSKQEPPHGGELLHLAP